MKRLFNLLLALLLSAAFIFSLASCAGEFKPSGELPKSTGDGGVPEDLDLNRILSGHCKEVLSELSAARKNDLKEALEAEGASIDFRSDGTVVITAADGAVMTQSKNGTWSIKADGGETQYGGNWPEDSKLASLLPRPAVGEVLSVSEDDDANIIVIAMSGVTIPEMREYAEQVKAAGFNRNVEEESSEELYLFTAGSDIGYDVELAHGMGIISVTVAKQGMNDIDIPPVTAAPHGDLESPGDNHQIPESTLPYDGEGWPPRGLGAKVPPLDGYETDYFAFSDINQTVSVVGVTIDALRAYIAKLTEAGFTINSDLSNQDFGGMAYLSYYAENSEGISVQFGAQSYSPDDLVDISIFIFAVS